MRRKTRFKVENDLFSGCLAKEEEEGTEIQEEGKRLFFVNMAQSCCCEVTLANRAPAGARVPPLSVSGDYATGSLSQVELIHPMTLAVS